MKSLGQRIRELRDGKNLSLRELSAKAQVSRTSLSDIEHGRRGPSDSMLRALAKALDTTFEDLKQLDDWPAIKEIKRRILIDPKFMFAVRRLLEAKVPAEALIKLAEDKSKRKKK